MEVTHNHSASTKVPSQGKPPDPQPTSETARVASASRIEDQENTRLNSATDGSADKAFLTLRAHLALKGYSLSRTHGDDGPARFFVTRWNLVRELSDLAAVRAFAEQVGATP